MVASGFKLEATFANQTMYGGVFKFGTFTLQNVPMDGSRAIVGLPFGIRPLRAGRRCSAALMQIRAPVWLPF
jgi:hypothetical protein